MTTPRAAVPCSLDALSVEDLLAHIAANYQEVRRRELPDLIALARKVEHVHHDVPEAPLGLADVLERISLDLDMHMSTEEKVLFPAMLRDIHEGLRHPLEVMRGEHAAYAKDVAEIETLAHGFSAPEGACGSWRRLYDGLSQLCDGLREQIRIEDEVLFPRFEIAASPQCICAQG